MSAAERLLASTRNRSGTPASTSKVPSGTSTSRAVASRPHSVAAVASCAGQVVDLDPALRHAGGASQHPCLEGFASVTTRGCKPARAVAQPDSVVGRPVGIGAEQRVGEVGPIPQVGHDDEPRVAALGDEVGVPAKPASAARAEASRAYASRPSSPR